MPDEPREVEPVADRQVTDYPGFPADVVTRAVSLIIEHRSIADAWRILKAELEAKGKPSPVYSTVTSWARQSEGCLAALSQENKREMMAISSDAARAWGGRMIELADSDQEFSPKQIGVNFGISMERRADWEKGGTGNQMNVQFNLVTRGQDKGDKPDSE